MAGYEREIADAATECYLTPKYDVGIRHVTHPREVRYKRQQHGADYPDDA